jgi:hypothetical protein
MIKNTYEDKCVIVDSGFSLTELENNVLAFFYLSPTESNTNDGLVWLPRKSFALFLFFSTQFLSIIDFQNCFPFFHED